MKDKNKKCIEVIGKDSFLDKCLDNYKEDAEKMDSLIYKDYDKKDDFIVSKSEIQNITSNNEIVSKEEIIEKCNSWLKMYKELHDIFKVSSQSKFYRSINLNMQLSCKNYFSNIDENVNGVIIDLDIKDFNRYMNEGPSIAVDNRNGDILLYLLANVFDYYISQNYYGTYIENTNSSNYIFYSNEPKDSYLTIPLIADLSSIKGLQIYSRFIKSMIINHNLGISNEELISNLKDNIKDQVLYEPFNKRYDYTKERYNIITERSSYLKQVLKKH